MFTKILLRKSSRVDDIVSNYKPLGSEWDRLTKLFSNAALGLLYPSSGQYLSTFGECSSYRSLEEIHQKMKSDTTGIQILSEKPRIRSFCLDFEKLKDLPSNSLGKHYWNYMKNNQFNPDERPIVQHIGDIELAYIYQRYKEIHDFLHVIIGKDSSIYEEIQVKWFEFQQLGLTSAGLSSLIGPLRLNWSGKVEIFSHGGVEMIKLANSSKFCMNVYYEKHLEQDLEDFRKWFFDKTS